MRRKLLQWTLAMIAAALPAIPSLAQIPDGYYDSLKGKKGAELKNAIHDIIKTAKVYGYGSGKEKHGGDSGIQTGMKTDTISTDTLPRTNGRKQPHKVHLVQP